MKKLQKLSECNFETLQTQQMDAILGGGRCYTLCYERTKSGDCLDTRTIKTDDKGIVQESCIAYHCEN